MKKNKISRKIFKYGPTQAKSDLPSRKLKDNKTRGGKTLVIAGSAGMYGAAVLCARAASRSGAGYVYLMTDGKFPVQKNPDFLTARNRLAPTSYQAIALGPGFKNPGKLRNLILQLKDENFSRVVLDAEALNVVSQLKCRLPMDWIVTPHEGELSRLLGESIDKVRQGRKAAIYRAQKQLGCVVLLKGHRTLVADPTKIFEIQSGNSALAKAGTGDVLTGIIVALRSQGISPIRAACLGAYVHGLAADLWIHSKNDTLSLMASDLVKILPRAFYHCRQPAAAAPTFS